MPGVSNKEFESLGESDWRAIEEHRQAEAPRDGMHWYGQVYQDTPKSLMGFVGVKGTFWFLGEPRPEKKVENSR
jgi:hypothetical protein